MSTSTYLIQRRGLQAEIQDIVKRYIIDHRFKPGDALPGEGELARQMGISRPSLREAMKVLQTIGVIETRHGSGTYVGSLSLNPLADGLAFQILIAAQHSESAPQDLLDLVDLRKAIEMNQMRKAVGTHSDEQIARMRGIANEMRQMDPDSARFGERDLTLHQAFYQPVNSRVYSEFMRVFWKISNMAIRPYAPISRDGILDDHDRILDAIEARDTEAAVTAVRDHICHLDEVVRASFDPDSFGVDARRWFPGEDDEEMVEAL